LAGAIAIGIVGGGAFAILGPNYPIIIALVVVAVIAFLIIYIRIVSRLLIVELPLAMENDQNAGSVISRSWELTKGSVGRIQWIVLVAILVSLPLTTIVPGISGAIVGSILPAFLDPTSGLFLIVSNLLTLPVSFGCGALVTPFWQVIKAIIYYDLRSRKEGLGLEIRDR
jgi:membrane-anchored glycerophosphoryl diester phosphodiesterase (GDPDase)